MSWQAHTESELWDLINQAESRMSIPQMRLWETIRIDPIKWQQDSYGDLGNGFWVVGLIGKLVVWFNDIEDGFNISSYSEPGKIDEYCCNQDQLEWSVQQLINLIENGHGLARFGPPVPST